MLSLIADNLERLAELCRRYDVWRMELFGSAARGDFEPDSSDLDFLVAFRRDSTMSPADRYLGLLEELQSLFGRRVDLVDVRAHRNPYFMAEALKHRVKLYDARSEETSVRRRAGGARH